MNPFFSIVIPVYNVEKYLNECIQSVLSQRHTVPVPIEIILVDDGSTDKSGKICDEYEQDCEAVKVIHQVNQGSFQARRTGLKKAVGNYILCLDSDDLLSEYALQSLYETIVTSQADIIFYNILLMDESGIRPYYSDVFTKNIGRPLKKEEVFNAYFFTEVPVITSTAGKIIRKECFDIDKDYSAYGKLSTGDDTLQSAEVITRAHTFYYLNKNLYIYRRGSGMTSKFDPAYYSTFKKILTNAMAIGDFAENPNFRKKYLEKLLYTGCRAITQSKPAKNMSYRERKAFIASITKDPTFIKAMEECDLNSSNLKRKYKWMLMLLKIHAYFPLHVALKLM